MKSTQKLLVGILIAGTLALSFPSQGAISYDQNVTPDILFGSGNLNGAFTVDRDNGVELGLRAKVRAPVPMNVFNSAGNGTYTHQAGGIGINPPGGAATWSFEWSINSDYDGSSGFVLSDLTYALRMDNNPGLGTTYTTFDPINGVNPNLGVIFWDHGIGNNGTANGAGDNDINPLTRTVASYDGLIDNNNVAQNSWRPHFYMAFNPNVNGTYTFQLEAFDSLGGSVAMTEMTVNVVPEPSTYVAGALLLLPFGASVLRKLRKNPTA